MSTTPPADLSSLRAWCGPLDFVFFWGHTGRSDVPVGKSCLSQWYPAPFVIDGVRYATTEHWMMAEKARTFGDDEARARVLGDEDPAAAKKAGRAVRGFDAAAWSARSFDVVCTGNLAKFSQHDALRAFLLGTGDTVLVEASPVDAIWGIGVDENDPRARDVSAWRGENRLGFALMQVRAQLRATHAAR
jgi:ribA/ribD-fused uncharacterized protein